MTSEAPRTAEFHDELTAICDRLVNPSVSDAQERARQQRLVCVLLAAPFLAALPLAQAMATRFDVAAALAVVCALFGAAWAVLLFLTSTGRGTIAARAATGVGFMATGALVVAFGGLASPAVLLALALPVEALWVTRSRRSALGVLAALGAALAISAGFVGATDPGVLSGDAWHWLAPGLYGVLVAMRVGFAEEQGAGARHATASAPMEDRIDAAVLRLNAAGEVVGASARSTPMLGIDSDLLWGTGLFERIHVADRVAFLCALSDVRDAGEPQKLELRVRFPAPGTDGQATRYRHFIVELVAAGEGQTGETLLVLRDGDEIAALRRQLAEAIEEVNATEVAKGRFLATVSHELRTPLNAIIGFSDMLLHAEYSGPMSEKQAEQIGLIREAGNHLLSVVNAILDVSKIEAGSYQITPEPFELRKVLELGCAMMEPQAAAKGVDLTLNVPETVGELMADERAVQQILLNLVSNAVKFTPEGGRVEVQARRHGGSILLHVGDSGIGISQKDLEKLGRPFAQVQNDYTRQFQGTGLGLSLVKGLVELHNGTLSIESAPGMGTTVTVTLPRNGPDAAIAEAGRPMAVLAHGATETTRDEDDAALRKIA